MKKTHKRILFATTALATASLLSVSCSSEKVDRNDFIDTSGDKQKQKALDEAAKNAKITIESYEAPFPRDKKDIYFRSLKNPEQVKYKVENLDTSKFRVEFTNYDEEYQNGTGVSNLTGKGYLIFTFYYKDDKKEEFYSTREILEEGFKTNPFNANEDGSIPTPPSTPERERQKREDYVKGDQRFRYNFDNEDYIKTAVSQITKGGQRDIADFRKDVSWDKISAEKLDVEAEKLGLSKFQDALYKGFSVPSWNKDGTIDGLRINDSDPVGQGPSWLDSVNHKGEEAYKTVGLARYLINEKYKDYALQTFHAAFNNPEDRPGQTGQSYDTAGTLWILDFEKKDDNSYPTKWYFGTNLHVVNALTDKTNSITIGRLNKDASIHTKFDLFSKDANFSNFIFKKSNDGFAVKTVFTGEDYLKTNPAQFLASDQKEKYKDYEEFADFAVLEVDFEKAVKNGVEARGKNTGTTDEILKNAQELAKLVTNDYATETTKHISFLKTSYLQDYEKVNRDITKAKEGQKPKEVDEHYLVGYPSSIKDFYLDQYEDADSISRQKSDYSLWTNAAPNLYNAINKLDNGSEEDNYSISKSVWDHGNYLSYEIGYRSFTDKPGVTDEFIASPILGSEVITSSQTHKKLLAMGLAYMPRFYAPAGGSSGSSMRNQRNELVAVFHAANDTARTGLAAAFRSEGFDYKGVYGSYNLPQYDLIYGGGDQQKNSYREAMKKLYPGAKTNLFQNGFDQIPEEYKFKKTTQGGTS
ncbi:Ig-specific serine endopeptidase MIP [Mycoplasma procyoni]|uniref:Ig-specific serine endopeptidase MIP n=1 Tax=Mycoplasma procyoni TaxID=568784 RepID=UPI00197B40D9|nr:DUF31 family protein [Mycoplasma procyoni]MBN3534740.1 DUF31 family protein [Mycoplasma procyoni]